MLIYSPISDAWFTEIYLAYMGYNVTSRQDRNECCILCYLNHFLRSLSQLSLAEKFGSGLSLGPGQLYLVHTPGQMEMLHQTLSLSKALVETGTLFKQQVL